MMASQSPTDTAIPSANVVGNMFVERYYLILHQRPEDVKKFYMDCSVLSRPGSNGVMQSVTTIQAIDEKIMSLDYKNYTVEIKTVDAQHSYKDGVIVLVTGLLIGKESRVQKFTQSFFLAPMEMDHAGYFVLNDVFRFVAEDLPEEMDFAVVNGPDASDTSTPTTSADSTTIPVHDTCNGATTLPEESNGCIEAEDQEPLENRFTQVDDVREPSPSTNMNSQSLEDTPKKSYASIVKVTRMATASPSTSSPAVKVQTTPVNADKDPVNQPSAKVQSDSVNSVKNIAKKPLATTPNLHPKASTANADCAAENSSPSEAAEGFSIYIRNLPLNATPSLVEDEFKKFGAIKPGGVQVRNHKQHGYCFGFVEFAALTSMESALEATVIIAGRRIVIEEKKTTTRVGPGGIIINGTGASRGRFPVPRGGFRNYGVRNDGFRERGGFSGGQVYGRIEFRARGEFLYRGRGGGGSTSEGYQRVCRTNPNSTAVTAA